MVDLSPVNVTYQSAATLRAALGSNPSLLGVVHYGLAPLEWEFPGPCMQVPLHAACSAEPLVEVWTSASAVQRNGAGALRYAHNGTVLFGGITLPEVREADFERAVERIYNEILGLLRSADYPYPLRMWNYFPDIHLQHAGLDRYQRFCAGRQRAFAVHPLAQTQEFPAATVIGAQSGPLIFYFLAARTPGQAQENPRQVSAFHYPEEYGPVSPAFSRGIFKRWNGAAHFFISGTASIVGHATQHAHQREQQVEEIMRNLHALTEHAAQTTGTPLALAARGLLKVYVPDLQSGNAVREQLVQRFPDARVMYLQGEVCRSELLVEIEAVIDTAGR